MDYASEVIIHNYLILSTLNIMSNSQHSEQYIRDMVPIMELIRDDRLDEAKERAALVRQAYSWNTGEMDVDAVEIMNNTQEYLDGLGQNDKQSLLKLFWEEIGYKYFGPEAERNKDN